MNELDIYPHIFKTFKLIKQMVQNAGFCHLIAQELTHWSLGDVAVISIVYIWNSLYNIVA